MSPNVRRLFASAVSSFLSAFLILTATVVTPTAPASAADGMVGAVGCSQTNHIFVGLGMIGATGFWPREAVTSYGGGALYEWADTDSSYWDDFAAALNQNPQTSDVWIEICVKQPDSPIPTAEDLAAGETIVEEVRSRAPNAQIYVSAMNGYEGVVCFLSGVNGPLVAQGIADHLVETGQAQAGPVVGPLDPSMVGDDDCHANDAGRIFQAEQLNAFFYGDGGPPPAPSPIPANDDVFQDIGNSVFKLDIEWLADEGITTGCNPPDNTLFCPYDPVTRGQMAAFLHRALPNLREVRPAIDFVDDDGSSFEADIEWLYSRGIAEGTSPTTYDPYDPVTRAQMAAFLVRALGYSDDGGGDLFIDDDASVFELEIDQLGTAGITSGCNPPENDMFCPGDSVSRGQMAAFLHRAVGG